MGGGWGGWGAGERSTPGRKLCRNQVLLLRFGPRIRSELGCFSLRANGIVDELRDVGPHHRPGRQLSAGNTDRDVSVPYTLTHAHTQQYDAYPPTTVGADPQGLNTANKSTDTFRSQNDFRL